MRHKRYLRLQGEQCLLVGVSFCFDQQSSLYFAITVVGKAQMGLFVCLLVCLFVLFVCLFVCFLFLLFVCLSVCLFVCLSQTAGFKQLARWQFLVSFLFCSSGAFFCLFFFCCLFVCLFVCLFAQQTKKTWNQNGNPNNNRSGGGEGT